MSSTRATAVRAVAVGCAVAGAATIGAAPANALPVAQPAFTHHDFRVTTFAGTPLPLAAAAVSVDAATNGTGVIRFTVGRRCASTGGRPCGYAVDVSVQWVNATTGRSGTTAIGRATPKFVTTGRGPVGLSFGVPGTLSVPSFGLVNP